MPGAKPVFVHGALPGERITAEIIKETTGHAFALTKQVEAASPSRIPSDCPVFPVCGGCSFRHMSYADELRVKTELLQSMGFEIERVFSAEPRGYRTHVRVQAEKGQYGFFGLYSNRIVPMPADGCANLPAEMNDAIRKYFSSGKIRKSQGGVSFRLDQDNVIGPGDEREQTLELPGVLWHLPADAFVQANRFLLTDWLGVIEKFVPEKSSLVELYCGTGLIGGFLGKRLGSYFGADFSAGAIEAARANFKRMGLEGKFECLDLERTVPALDADCILVNPARQGLSKLVRESLATARAGRIVYSSCNASTLRRDLTELQQTGWKPSPAMVFDFFPRTPHTELVVWLERA